MRRGAMSLCGRRDLGDNGGLIQSQELRLRPAENKPTDTLCAVDTR